MVYGLGNQLLWWIFKFSVRMYIFSECTSYLYCCIPIVVLNPEAADHWDPGRPQVPGCHLSFHESELLSVRFRNLSCNKLSERFSHQLRTMELGTINPRFTSLLTFYVELEWSKSQMIERKWSTLMTKFKLLFWLIPFL